jgi:AP-2 complex subunit alpha
MFAINPANLRHCCSESPKSVQKKAALAALRLFREAPEQLALVEHAANIIQLLTSADKV